MAAIALVTTDLTPSGFDEEDLDLEPLLAAFRRAGHHCVAERWIDDDVDWAGVDAAIIRSPWDYPERVDDFSAWLERTSQVTTVLNPPELIGWNLNKEYMLTLEHLGVPIVPTLVAYGADEVRESIGAIVDSGFGQLVIKPTVSAGSRDTGLYTVSDPAAMTLALSILRAGKAVMVQPAIPGVSKVGERGLVFFDGEYSHAFSKGPLLELGGGLIGGQYVERLAIVEPTDAQLEVANSVLDALCAVGPGLGGNAPLYARIDLVDTAEGPLLMEAELFEPSFNVYLQDGIAERFVAAVEAHLG